MEGLTEKQRADLYVLNKQANWFFGYFARQADRILGVHHNDQ